MTQSLTTTELKNLIKSVFSITGNDRQLVILVDVPDTIVADNLIWRERRIMAASWHSQLDQVKSELNLEQVNLLLYPNVHSNNANLPEIGYRYNGDIASVNAATLKANGTPQNIQQVLHANQLAIALTQLSATAPLKLFAPQCGFRAVTMPGFSANMIPSLKLDYEEINNRIMKLKNILDPAIGLAIEFELTDHTKYTVYFDLRYRKAHASGGRFPEAGTAGNLPGGECYIVPYEGEKGELSKSQGILPVQFEDEIVLYEIEENKAKEVLSTGHFSKIEARKIDEEPAYANIAEIGFGILRYFGIKPIGEILLDEKLGLHIAFGRSDHFGGAVGIAHFSSPQCVVHIDRIYIAETQSKVLIKYVKAIKEDGGEVLMMKDGEYVIF